MNKKNKNKWRPAISIIHTESRTSNALRLSTKVLLLFIISKKEMRKLDVNVAIVTLSYTMDISFVKSAVSILAQSNLSYWLRCIV